jgi:hypothetical protein
VTTSARRWYIVTLGRQDADGRIVEHETVLSPGGPAAELVYRYDRWRQSGERAEEVWHLVAWCEASPEEARKFDPAAFEEAADATA